MTADARRYVAGVALVAVATGAVALLLPDERGRGAWFGLTLSLLVQAPLGWWLVRSLGTARFLPAWIAGMGGRVGLVALAGFVILPALRWPLGPGLVGLAAVLLALLGVEVFVVMAAGRSKVEAR
ncbi:MAG TPA: hypothetical protein VGR60_05065 [Gemmatimonadales bacterium]|nr:hypothetical protein [Gemmatimonadales bacterium]